MRDEPGRHHVGGSFRQRGAYLVFPLMPAYGKVNTSVFVPLVVRDCITLPTITVIVTGMTFDPTSARR
jgi:hypothetical protein